MQGPSELSSDDYPRERRVSFLWLGLLAYVAAGVIALSPLLWTPIPPLIDYYDHLTRIAVLAHRDPTGAISTNYVVHWRLVPNLAIDLVGPALARLMPVEIAGRVFIAIIMLMLVAGTATLHRVLHGRFGLWPICSILFLYNDLLAGGVLAVLFGFGVMLLAFSLWIASESWPFILRLTVFAIIAAVIFILHLFAFGVFGVLIASYEVGRAFDDRHLGWRNVVRHAANLLQFIPAGLLWIGSIRNMGPVSFFLEGDLREKIEVWLSATSFNSPRAPLDDLIFAVTAAFLIFGFATRALILAPRMRLPIAACVITAWFMPLVLSGAWSADARLPVALLFLTVGATRLDSKRWPRTVAAFAGIACVLFATRIVAVTASWRVMDRQIAEFRGAIRTLPRGVRMMMVESPWPQEAHQIAGVPEALEFRPRAAYQHVDTLAVLDRGAFVTDFFTRVTAVQPTARNAGLGRDFWRPLRPEELATREHVPPSGLDALRQRVDGLPPCCYDWPHVYNYIFWVDFGHPPAKLPHFLTPWAAGSYFHIYRIVPP